MFAATPFRRRPLRFLAGPWLAIASLAFSLSEAHAATSRDWPQFRGPTGDGHATAKNVPLNWSATDNVAWKVAVPGKGWSSPVLSQGRVYLTSAIPGSGPDDLKLAALAFDAADGRLLWQTAVFEQGPGSPGIHRKNSHASPTPVVNGNRVFVHFGHMGTAALDTDGKVLWRNTELKYAPMHGNGATPILVDDRLVFGCDGSDQAFFVALRQSDGGIAWKTDRRTDFPQKFSFATATLIESEGRRQIVCPFSGYLAGYDPADGKELWRSKHDGFSLITKPVFAHGLLFYSTGYEAPLVAAVRPGKPGDGDVTASNLAWTLRKGAPNTPSFLVIGDELYYVADSGVLSCVDARTGKVQYQERAGGQTSASPVFAEGRIYLLDEQGLGTVVAPGKEFRKLAENPLGERTLASYAVTDGALFVRSEEHLFRIGSRP